MLLKCSTLIALGIDSPTLKSLGTKRQMGVELKRRFGINRINRRYGEDILHAGCKGACIFCAHIYYLPRQSLTLVPYPRTSFNSYHKHKLMLTKLSE